jgi:hypothetical protein
MKNKIAILCVLTLAAGLLVFVGTGLSASAPKATGGVGFTVPGDTLQRWVEFQVQAVSGDTAKGMLNYHDADGYWYKADLQCLTVVDGFAFFSGPVVKSRPEEWVGLWVKIAVFDGGSPSESDLIWGTFCKPGSTSDCWCGPRSYQKPIPWFPVTSGNLVVH